MTNDSKIEPLGNAFFDEAQGNKLRSEIVEALNHYRCQYTYDIDGGGLDLVDVLSPGDVTRDISTGKREIDLIADHVVCKIMGV